MSVSILVVDDEPDAAEMFRQCFRREARQGTYVLHFACSGKNPGATHRGAAARRGGRLPMFCALAVSSRSHPLRRA
jgi:hypothetical protein